MKKSYIKININDLKVWSKNPKKHREDLIEKSINELGYITPIVVDENNRILAGHGRYKALKKLGIKEVDVIKVEGLSEEQKEKFALIDNKSTIEGDFDIDKLFDFDENILLDAGFSLPEVSFIKGEEIEYLDTNKLIEMYSVIIRCSNEEEQKDVMKKLNLPKSSVKYKDFLKYFTK